MALIAQVQVNLFCGDVEGCLGFYRALGLGEVFRAPAQGAVEHVEVEVAGVRIGLTSVRVANALVGLGVEPPAGGASAEVVFWCDDPDELYERALAAGGSELVAPRKSPDGRLRVAWVKDPDGHQVKFVRLIHRD
jgi:catechol 2,3-dioxygenase-like lactoylglutathione lyase family enzyme